MKYVETATKTFTAGGALAYGTRVKLGSGVLSAAGITDKDIGTVETPAFASGDPCTVRLRSAQGTCEMIASEAITAGAAVYTAADGKVSDTAAATSFYVGEAMETASGDGSIIEVLRGSHGDTANE
jgi:hypothetical protein